MAVSWDFAESGMERSADGDILSSVWNSRRQVVEETAGEEGCNKEIREKSGEIRCRKGICIRHRRKQGRRAKKNQVVDHPKSENMETEDLKTDRNSASDTSADTERIRNSQISGQQELNADDTDRNSLKKRQFFIKRIYDRIRNIFQLIRTKLQNIRRTFGKIKKNVSWWKAFIEHPRVTAARKLVWKHGKFLLKHIFPTRIEGQVTFSFEDPALTGAALAVLGMTIPFHKNCIQINPRFDSENYLYGNIRAKGRIYGFVPVRAAVSIYFNKNIKYVINRWKHKED